MGVSMISYELLFSDGFKMGPLTITDSVRILKSNERVSEMRELLLNFAKRLSEKTVSIEIPKLESLDLCEINMIYDGTQFMKIDLKSGVITRADGETIWADKDKNNRRYILFSKVYTDIQFSKEKAFSESEKIIRFPVIGMQWTYAPDMTNHKVCVLFDPYLKDIELFEDEDAYVPLLKGENANGALQVYYTLAKKEGNPNGI